VLLQDRSGTLDSREIHEALTVGGFNLSPAAVDGLFRKQAKVCPVYHHVRETGQERARGASQASVKQTNPWIDCVNERNECLAAARGHW
jgi:hypothetical protein